MVFFSTILPTLQLLRFLIKEIYTLTALLVLVPFVCRLSAQTSFPVQLESLNINNGLSQSFVSGILQDQKGLMWFTTSDGLNKYDGYTFTVYHHDPDDSTSIGSDDLTCMFEDAKGRLWLGTRHNGIDFFDRENNRFSHIRHSGSNSLQSDNIMSIAEDKSGNLWIRTEQGIDCAEIVTDKPPPRGRSASGNALSLVFTHIRLDAAFEAVRYKYESAKVFVDSRSHVYITTNSRIWEAFYRQKQYTYTLAHRYTFPVIDSFQIADLTEDLASASLLLNTRDVIRFPRHDFDAAVRIFRSVRAQTPWTLDKRHRLWMPDSNRIIQLQVEPLIVQSAVISEPRYMQAIAASTVLFTDRTGVIWIGTGGYGILRYDPEKENFHHILPDFISYQLLESRPGRIAAIGVNSSYSIDIRRQDPVTIRPLADEALMAARSLQFKIGSFAEDTTGNYWFGLHAHIIRYQVKERKLRFYPMPVSEKATLPFPLYADRRENLWMGYNRYFVRYNIRTGLFTRYEYPVRMKSYEYDFLQSIYEDRGLLWLGSANGLFRFNIATGEMRHYTARFADTGSVSNNVILSMCNDTRQPGRYLWIGTKGGGLNRMDKQTGELIRYTTKNGLPNNVIYGILPDEEGRYWLSTNKGLSEFNPRSVHFRNFDVSDGLQSNEFNRYAYCKTEEGLMVFGGMNGINYFNPSDIRVLPPPPVVLTDFRMFNKTVNFKKPGSPIGRDIGFTSEIHLRYEQNVITFQFAAMDYRKPGNAQYRYMMHGFDKDWIYSGTVREATYTNLDPGTYEFTVQGSLGEGVWGTRTTSVAVIIVPPWWQRWWFYGIIISSTMYLTFVLYQYRLNQVIKLERVRNRIARDLHDEVGSSISTIAIYSKILQEHLGTGAFNNAPLLTKITDNAQEIMEAMNDIVWNINTRNDAFENIISRMREHAYQLFEAKGYTLHFYFDDNLARMKLGMEKRRDFYLIYKEALNNIAKYANGKNVWITLTVHNSGIRLTIKDDGQGFERKEVRRSSNGLGNMEFRAAALQGKLRIISAPDQGTEIILAF